MKSWFGVPVDPNNNLSPSERRIYLDYKHLYGTASFDQYGWNPLIQIILDVENDTWHQSDDIWESECTDVAYHNKGSDV